MLRARLLQRVPGAKVVGVGLLRGHALRWHKVAKDGSGKCDIPVDETDSLVYGVLYEIPEKQKTNLDRAEGLGYGYDEMQVCIEVGSTTYSAVAYYATKIDRNILPFTWYKALVVAGAVEHGLPPVYVEKLRAVTAVQDPDAKRHAEHMALAGEA
jgi:hypothetical protein